MLFSIYVARLFFLISMKRLPSLYSNSLSVFLSHTQEMEDIDNKRSQRPSQLKVGHRKKKRERKMKAHLNIKYLFCYCKLFEPLTFFEIEFPHIKG